MNVLMYRILRLQVAGNTLNMQGWINAPLSANPRYNFDADARFDLATIREFYPIDEDTLMIRGMFTFDGSASGNLERPEDARISGALNLTDGFIRHRDICPTHRKYPHPLHAHSLGNSFWPTSGLPRATTPLRAAVP